MAIRGMIVLVSLALAAAGWAEETEKSSATTNTVITSKRLMFDYRRSIAVFEEDVVVVDPQMKIKSDKMNVIFDKENNVKSVTALGNVHIWQDDKTATCNQAVYITLTGEVIMTGEPKLHRGRDSLAGTKITFWTNDDKVTCERPHLVIFPDEGERTPLDLEI